MQNDNNLTNMKQDLGIGSDTVQLDQIPNMVQSGTNYSTAMRVIQPRNLQTIQRKCEEEAAIAGDDFYYSWSQGGKIIEGLTVGAALTIVRNYGNCAVDVRVEETATAYIFHGVFVDLETGYNLTRPFRQNKKSPTKSNGKAIYTGDRGNDIIFQIGASKAIRNVVLNACPVWLGKKVLAKAKENVSAKISQMGPVKARELLISKSEALGIPLEKIERNYGKAKGWDTEKLVMVSGALRSIEDGYETADSLFPEGITQKIEVKTQPTTTQTVTQTTTNQVTKPARVVEKQPQLVGTDELPM